MPYLDCPRCHASFHTGTLYAPPDYCPRCGAALNQPRPGLPQRARGIFSHRRNAGDVPDWEAITGSQYTGQRVRRIQPEE